MPPPRLAPDDRRPARRAGEREEAPAPSGTFKGVIRCLYHSWCYELDGAVRNAPYLGEADGFEPGDFGLHPVALDTWGGWIFVNASPERVAAGHTLAAQLGEIPARIARYPLADLRTGAPDRLRRAGQLEGHRRELQRVLPLRGRPPGAVPDRAGVPRGAARTSTGTTACPQGRGRSRSPMTGTTDRAPFPGLDEHEQTRHKGELAYPNLMISLSADHVAAFTLVPKAPDRTLIVVDWLFHPDEMAKPSFDPSDAVDFWDLVNRQDWTVCEGVQDGMTSRRFGSAGTRRWRT